jgi:type IV secretion system protein VirB2
MHSNQNSPSETTMMSTMSMLKHRIVTLALAALCAPLSAQAQGFDKISSTVNNVQTLMVTISVAVVTIAIIWAGFKMIFQGARLSDVANVLIGGALIGGSAAIATDIVS